MAIELDHVILAVNDRARSSRFLQRDDGRLDARLTATSPLGHGTQAFFALRKDRRPHLREEGAREFRFAFRQGRVGTSLGTWCRTGTCGDLAPAPRGQSFAFGQ